MIKLNLFGSNSPQLATSDFVGWVERSDTHQIPDGQQAMGIAAVSSLKGATHPTKSDAASSVEFDPK
jgi:hypothetical protein